MKGEWLEELGRRDGEAESPHWSVTDGPSEVEGWRRMGCLNWELIGSWE